MTNIRQLLLPAGIYCIFNPYQALDGVVAKLTGAIQKPNNIKCCTSWSMTHLLCLAGRAFGQYHMYCGIQVWWRLPLQCCLGGPILWWWNYQEQLQMVKISMERAGVPNDWMQVVLFGGNVAIGYKCWPITECYRKYIIVLLNVCTLNQKWADWGIVLSLIIYIISCS